MPQRLESVKIQLDNLYQQQAAAKEEVGKAFPYEEELRVKNARLVELDMELNMDSKGQSRPEAAIAKRERPSVLEGLKRPSRPAAWKRNPDNRNRRQDNMNSNEKNTALYEKMAAEQDTFRDWLKSQSPEEVLNHAYEYTVREDIVMAMEELELSDNQAQALLDSPSPLADVYRHFEKLETGYMDVIRESIEERANEMCKEKEEQRAAPVYPHSAAYASEHGEMAQYRASLQVSLACKEAIEQAISAHYGDNRLNTEAAVKEVLEQFGPERVQVILANTVLKKEHDGRISRDNKAWAKTIPMPEDGQEAIPATVMPWWWIRSNPGLTDLFLKQARESPSSPGERLRPGKTQTGAAGTQNPPPLRNGNPERLSAAKRKREVQVNFRVSPEELALIEQKMAQLGTVNREAYLRKMALDGYVVKLDLPELKELVPDALFQQQLKPADP